MSPCMLHPECQNCAKPKVIHLTQIIEGKVKQLDLCESCPNSKKISNPVGFDLLGDLLPAETKPEKNLEKLSELRCPNCGCIAAEFKKSGRLGCPDCYAIFFHVLQPVLRDMHRGTRHKGKWPKNAGNRLELRDEINRLQREIMEAVERENFEQAALIRDKIKDLKTKSSATNN